MLKFRRSNIWQWEPGREERNAMESVNKALQKKQKRQNLLGQTNVIAGAKPNENSKSKRIRKKHHQHNHSNKLRRTMLKKSRNQDRTKEEEAVEDLQKRKVQERERLRKLFLSKDTSHVRAASRLPFKTTTPAMTPMIPYEDEIQMDVFGKVMVKRNSYESLDAVPQYNRLIHTYFKWSQMPNRPKTPRSEFLAECEEQNILPERLDGIIRLTKAAPVDISHYGMGKCKKKFNLIIYFSFFLTSIIAI